jgi:hypothetical protein
MGCICPNSKQGENMVILDIQQDKTGDEYVRRPSISSKKSDKEKSPKFSRSYQEPEDNYEACNKTGFAVDTHKSRKSNLNYNN